jgi:hypothetical protein
MPPKQIAERQFNLSFLNTSVSALALIVFGSTGRHTQPRGASAPRLNG